MGQGEARRNRLGCIHDDTDVFIHCNEGRSIFPPHCRIELWYKYRALVKEGQLGGGASDDNDVSFTPSGRVIERG